MADAGLCTGTALRAYNKIGVDEFPSIPISFFSMIKKFSFKKISDNIYKIEEKWFKEHANFYLFKGDKFDLLIDCGLGLFDIKKFLEKKGFKNIKVALTHSHFDHIGGIKSFLPKDILITKRIYKNCKNKHLLGLKFLNLKDFHPAIDLFAVNSLFQNFEFLAKPKNIRNIKTGNFNFKIIGTPGHTDESVVYYDIKNKILVTGDALYSGKMYYDFSNSNAQKFKKSLEFISSLDFNSVFPGHNNILSKEKSMKIISKWESYL